ncbi:MAG: HD domain-containing phosphohydrolase [Acetivibrio sp.]
MNSISTETLLNIGIALSKEKNIDKLLELIMDAAMKMTNCDAGTLYTCKENLLEFRVMITKSQNVYKGGSRGKIELPPVQKNLNNVCSYAAMMKTLINVQDVYEESRYDFSGPMRYDTMTGYKTTSMLVVPMEDEEGEVLGVLQLINSMEENGKIIPFSKEMERIIRSLASQTAISIMNANHTIEVREMLYSFIRSISAAIDERTPYNAYHTQHMVEYAKKFIIWVKEEKKDSRFVGLDEDEFIMSVWLHDVGKLTIPRRVMDKPTRLVGVIREIEHRFETIGYLNEIAYLKEEISKEEYEKKNERIEAYLAFIKKADISGIYDKESEQYLERIYLDSYIDLTGKEKPYLTYHEYDCLKIKKGTLTEKERKIMQSHVTMTGTLLEEVEFPKKYKRVPYFAEMHHELLNGSGYPNHLKEKEICNEVRLLTILDVYDALTAVRPYKKSMAPEKAFSILGHMVEDGQIDGEILDLFKESHAWNIEEEKCP